MKFEAEFDELVAAATAPRVPGEPRLKRAVRIGAEALDVVGASIQSLDQTNQVADLAELGIYASRQATRVAEALLGKRPLVLAGVKTMIPLAVPTAIAALGVYSPQIEAFKRTTLVPLVGAGDRVFSRLAAAIGT